MSWSSSAIILLSASPKASLAGPSLSLNLNPLIIDINIIMSRKMKMKRRRNSVAVSGLQLQQLGVVGMGVVVGVAPTQSHSQSQSDSHIVQDDLDALLRILPCDLRDNLLNEPKIAQLLEVILDLGCFPEARYLGEFGRRYLRNTKVSMKELEHAQNAVGEFGGDNRAGIEGTLHRISAIRSTKGMIVGLTCRVGRAVSGHVDMIYDLLQYGKSILFVGKPGVGKTTVMREIAHVLADEFHKRVVIVDTSNEIGGDGNIPHSAIGGARRMQVPDSSMQHAVMIEAVENHMPEVIMVDEIGTEAEAHACRSIAERGVMLIGTAHGQRLENIIKNPILSDLVGGVETVTLGDGEAQARNTQKTVLERQAPPTFHFLIEMRDRHYWVTHQTQKSVDILLRGKNPQVEVRKRNEKFKVVIEKSKAYDKCDP
ncbi:hypothetical protein RGQ29_029454 [Quercus rubra]|uniref:AAA+ ATPase domain-containing protein n=1 Tax=Quercus rubra TaxID=3512 RepID=A0AAN7EGJ1_QUERU|nr:hypothetical protein RGQ29_029454 [Quercus rubra]